MRIALMSATKRISNGELRAEQELAGRSVLAWQVDLAFKLGCERVICLCDAPGGDLIIAEQRRVEGQGLSFHALRNHLQLPNLVRESDILFVQLDGLVADGLSTDRLITRGNALDDDAQGGADLPNSIFELRSDHPLSTEYPSDFERIDRDKHWGGVAVLPGECVAPLTQMPEDAVAISLLLRIGLQASVPRKDVPAQLLDNNQWVLASDAEGLNARSNSLIAASLSTPHWTGAATALAASFVRATANRWLGSGTEIAAAVACAGLIIAAGLAGYGFVPSGIVVASLSAFSASLAQSSSKLRSGLSASNAKSPLQKWLKLVTLVFSCAVLVLANLDVGDWAASIAIPLFAMGLLYLAGSSGGKAAQAFFRDTPLHLAIFGICAFAGALQIALLVFGLGALLQLLLRTATK